MSCRLRHSEEERSDRNRNSLPFYKFVRSQVIGIIGDYFHVVVRVIRHSFDKDTARLASV